MRIGSVFTTLAQGGFTYVAMLFALAIFGVGLAAIGESWSMASRRDKEEELIRVGTTYVQAIGDYYRHSPGIPKTFPVTLQDLLADPRFLGTQRYLRRLYPDPISNKEAWGLVREVHGGIVGIYSTSERAPLRQQPLLLPDSTPISGGRYADWKFVFLSIP